MSTRVLAIITLTTFGAVNGAAAQDLEAVGIVTATQGTVLMQPATMKTTVPVKPYDPVGPLAILQTQGGSRCKVLYTDDSLLTLGEDSRLEVSEQTYRAGSDARAFVAHLRRGSVRALVGRQFEGDNSVFEIHAGTSVATARGTYFVVWTEDRPSKPEPKDNKGAGRGAVEPVGDEEGRSGVANIGRSGNVAFTSGGATVLVLPGQFALAPPGAAPTTPMAISSAIAPVNAALAGTLLAETPEPESPRAALAAVGLGGAGGAGSETGPAMVKSGPVAGQAASGAYVLPEYPWPVTPVTPPAVASGAVVPSTAVNLLIRLP
jgi:FecR-like protein